MIENITAEVDISAGTILSGMPMHIPITFKLQYSILDAGNSDCLSKTGDFDCLIELENLDTGDFFRDTFLVGGFDGLSNTFTVEYTYLFLEQGQLRISVCPDFSNNIVELNEGECK